MKPTQILKRANSKSQLAQAVVFYQRALSHYAKEENWAVRGEEIIWVGDDDPTYAAQVSLGSRKPDPTYLERNKPKLSGNRTNHIDTAQMGVVTNAEPKG